MKIIYYSGRQPIKDQTLEMVIINNNPSIFDGFITKDSISHNHVQKHAKALCDKIGRDNSK